MGKYTALEVNQELPLKSYHKYRIDGIDYDPVPVFDLPRHIAIEAQGNFRGKIVEFV